MFRWIFQFLSNFCKELVPNKCSIDLVNMHKEVGLRTWSGESFTKSQNCFYYGSNFNSFRLFKTLLHRNWCIKFCIRSSFIANLRWKKLHPIAFYSRKFSTAKINYEIHKKELLATIDLFKNDVIFLKALHIEWLYIKL